MNHADKRRKQTTAAVHVWRGIELQIGCNGFDVFEQDSQQEQRPPIIHAVDPGLAISALADMCVWQHDRDYYSKCSESIGLLP